MRVSGAGSARQAHTVGGTSHPAFHAGIDAAGVLRAAHDEAALLEEFGLKVGDQALSWTRIVCSLCQLRGRGVGGSKPVAPLFILAIVSLSPGGGHGQQAGAAFRRRLLRQAFVQSW